MTIIKEVDGLTNMEEAGTNCVECCGAEMLQSWHLEEQTFHLQSHPKSGPNGSLMESLN